MCWRKDTLLTAVFLGFPCGSAGKESACNAGDLGSIPGLGRSPGEGKGYPLQYSGLENSKDYIVHGVTSRTWLSHFHFWVFRLYPFTVKLSVYKDDQSRFSKMVQLGGNNGISTSDSDTKSVFSHHCCWGMTRHSTSARVETPLVIYWTTTCTVIWVLCRNLIWWFFISTELAFCFMNIFFAVVVCLPLHQDVVRIGIWYLFSQWILCEFCV